MKQKQEMQSRSLYMPESFWKEIDEVAEKEDLSANQVIRRLVSSWLLGILVESKEKQSPMRVMRRRESVCQ
jgi:predicted DNA-binding ribbon-helix-helix protein